MTHYPDSPQQFMEHVAGKIFAVCEAYYLNYLKPCATPEQAAQHLRIFLEFSKRRHTDHTLPVEGHTPPEDIARQMKDNAPIIYRLVDNLMEDNPPETEFYLKLWGQVQNQLLFPTHEAVVSSIILLFRLPQLPYYQLPDVPKMSEESYKAYSQQVLPLLEKAHFALNRGYTQKSQIASQLIWLYSQIQDPQAQVVFVAQLLAYHMERYNSLKKQLDEPQERARPDSSAPQ